MEDRTAGLRELGVLTRNAVVSVALPLYRQDRAEAGKYVLPVRDRDCVCVSPQAQK